MLAFMFPGQGSQKRGMGSGLFDEVPEFTAIEAEADACLGYSLRQLCLEDPENRLKQTQYTQVALYVINALHYYKALSQGERPDFLAGHSVGEYNALLAAGAFDFLTGLRLVQKRGELMSKAKNGGMAAVIGLDVSKVNRILKENAFTNIDVANFNSPVQTVISGPVDEITRSGPMFEKAGAQLFIALQVSAAFHSRYMAEAASAFSETLSGVSFHPLQTPVIANVTGHPYPGGNPTATIRFFLEKQITQPVLWTLSVRTLLDNGVSSFRELGPGMVLTKLVQQVQQEADAHKGVALV